MAFDFLQSAPIPGTRLIAHLWRTSRPSGRRIKVYTLEGILAFDTDDHYDFANALDSLQRWLRSEEGAIAAG